ncbi:transposase [Neochlamydia sp. S13]|uniref:transposase n=1 Tax=Neochlamydia sp. S13 TaxID=1353976 RepID=UPI001315275E
MQRGSITLWLSDETIKGWRENKSTGKKRHPRIYSADAILSALMIRAVYHLPLLSLARIFAIADYFAGFGFAYSLLYPHLQAC